MVVFTAKLTKRKVVAAFLVLGIVACSAIVAMRNVQSGEILPDGEEQVMQIEDKKLRTNDDRVTLLEGYGWTVNKEPLEFMEVRIPEEFDGVYNDYNEIQKKQGLDLMKYSGKRAMKYTYSITNHPSKEEGVVANLIIYRNKLIAGDVCSPKLGGFMHGLSETSQTGENVENNTTEPQGE